MIDVETKGGLGNKEFEENKKFGENIAKTADIAIVVNETNKESIVQGLTEGGMNPENIFTAPTLDHAQIKLKEILQKGDVVLFEMLDNGKRCFRWLKSMELIAVIVNSVGHLDGIRIYILTFAGKICAGA